MSDTSSLVQRYLAGAAGDEARLSEVLARHAQGAVLAYVVFGLGLAMAVRWRLFDRVDAALRGRLSGPGAALTGSGLLAASLIGLGLLAQGAGSLFDPSLRADLARGLSSAGIDVLLLAGLIHLARSVLGRGGRRGAFAVAAVGALAVFLFYSLGPLGIPQLARGDAATTQGGPLLDFIRQGGLRAERLYVFNGTDPADVDLEGAFGVTHAAVSRAALSHPVAQTYAALGHLLGHAVHGDMIAMGALCAAFFVAGLFAAVFAAPVLARAALGPNAPSPFSLGSLPIVALTLWALTPVERAAFNAFDQAINYRADAYALALTGDRDALCRWAVKGEGQTASDPNAFEALFFYDHPPLRARIARILTAPAAGAGVNLAFAKNR